MNVEQRVKEAMAGLRVTYDREGMDAVEQAIEGALRPLWPDGGVVVSARLGLAGIQVDVITAATVNIDFTVSDHDL